MTHAEELLDAHFNKYGPTTECAIIRDKSGASRGFGFVTYRNESDMDAALAEGDEHVINGFPVEVKRSTHGESAALSSKKVFVGGVGPTVSKDTLREYFSAFGNVADAQVMYDYASGRSRGFGFVTFDDEESARRCMETSVHVMAGQMVDVKAAQPRPSERNNHPTGGKNGQWANGHDMRHYAPQGYGGGYRSRNGRGAASYFAYPQPAYMADFAQFQFSPAQFHPGAVTYTSQVMGSPAGVAGMGYGNHVAYHGYGTPTYVLAAAQMGDQGDDFSSMPRSMPQLMTQSMPQSMPQSKSHGTSSPGGGFDGTS